MKQIGTIKQTKHSKQIRCRERAESRWTKRMDDVDILYACELLFVCCRAHQDQAYVTRRHFIVSAKRPNCAKERKKNNANEQTV